MKLRTDITNRIHELAKKAQTLDLDVMGLYKEIFQSRPPYRKGRYDLVNGCLFVDGVCHGRFEPLPPKQHFDEESYHIEGMLLARSEIG